MVATPALTRSVAGDSSILYLGVQLRRGTADVAAVERRWNSSERYFTDFQVSSQLQAAADQSIRPEALALGVFGAIAGLAALLLGIQLVARRLGAREHDLAVMRAVGADPATTTLDGLAGILGSVLAGAVLAVGVALALSSLFPIGPVRPVYPDRGVNADWTVLGVGFAVMVLVLGAGAVVLAYLGTPHRLQRRSRSFVRRSSTVGLTARTGLPPSAVAGASFAVDARSGRTAGPYRWALLAAVIAMVVVTTTLTFGASLQRAGVPPGALRVELGLRRAELRRLRARPEPGGGDAAARSRGGVVLGRLVRDHAAGRGRGAHLAVRPGVLGDATRHLRPRAGGAAPGRPRRGDAGPAAQVASATQWSSSTCPAIRAAPSR